MSEQFELSKELIDQIVFGMENQDDEFVLDPRSLRVLPREQATDEQTECIELPPWRSVDGYNVMERFVGTLHNPIFRERLRDILASGRGVFRQFKNALKERRDIEKVWFAFKEREMRSVVVTWYNDLRDQWGLEHVELDGDRTDQLVYTDFVFREATDAEARAVAELDRHAFDEVYAKEAPQTVSFLYALGRANAPQPDASVSRTWVAATPADEFAGFLWAVEPEGEAPAKDGEPAPNRPSVIAQLYVVPEYRGLGLAGALLDCYREDALHRGLATVLLDLHGSSLSLADSLEREGFERLSTRFRLDLRRWHRENHGL